MTVDLFVTFLYFRLTYHFNPVHDPMSLGKDTMLQTWDNLQAYALFPLCTDQGSPEQVDVVSRGRDDLSSEGVVPGPSGFVNISLVLSLRMDLLRTTPFPLISSEPPHTTPGSMETLQ